MLSVAFKNLKYEVNDRALDEAASDRKFVGEQQSDVNI
jgi:hypothetical protein